MQKHDLTGSLCDEQRSLASKVVVEDDFGPLNLIGGMDVSAARFDPRVFGACVVVKVSTCETVECTTAMQLERLPYIPGYLAFREAPVLVEAFHKLEIKPDLLFVDGQGIAHPRGLGIASHMGVLLDIPTIGVAKTILVGEPTESLGSEALSTVPLVHHGKVVAKLVRTKKNVKPLIISTGHKVSLDTAVSLVLKMCKGYRLPEPTRQAHLASNRYRKAAL